MLRKYWILGLLAGQVVLFLLLLSVFLRQPVATATAPDLAPPQAIDAAPLAQGTAGGLYVWSFAAKFVCGFQPPSSPTAPLQGEPVVKPGNYATEINIHNYNYKATPLRKKFLALVRGQSVIREPQAVEPSKILTMTLGPDLATMDDCNNLWVLMNSSTPPSPMPLFIGYLVILSPLDLDVDAVYTANAPGDLAATPTSVAINVNRVTGKRVFLPTNVFP